MARISYKDWITEEGLLKIEGWARDGLTDEQIAHNIGCNRTTLYVWIKKFPDISDALKKGKEVVDRKVENSLLKRALGYHVEDITYENGVEVKRVRKHIAPDTTAMIFWLKNRKKEWNDKHSVEHTGDVTFINGIMSNMTEEELRKLAKLDE